MALRFIALLFFVFSASPAFAIVYPLTSDDISAAIALGEDIGSLRDLMSNSQWIVPCRNYSGANPLHVFTPFFDVVATALDAKARFEDASMARAKGVADNETGRLTMLGNVISRSISDNTDPVMVISQGDKIIKPLSTQASDADPSAYGFLRSVTAKFDLRTFDSASPFEVIISHIEDDGREQLTYEVNPKDVQ